MSQTNETKKAIINFLFSKRILVWPNGTGSFASSYTNKAGETKDRWITIGKVGTPDILCICPRTGPFLAGVEVKTGKDRLRPEQVGFITNAALMGAVVLVVKSYEDFLTQWNNLCLNPPPKTNP